MDYEGETDDYVNLPFLPVRVFKEMDLRSCNEDEVFKTITSSGTSGQAVSKIYLDKETPRLSAVVSVSKILSPLTDMFAFVSFFTLRLSS